MRWFPCWINWREDIAARLLATLLLQASRLTTCVEQSLDGMESGVLSFLIWDFMRFSSRHVVIGSPLRLIGKAL